MNKKITQRIFAALAVALFFTGLINAQILTDYLSQATTGETIDTVTVGSTTDYYVYPDLVYSPSYNPATNANLGANEAWTWDLTAAGGSTDVTPGGSDANYIRITWTGTAGQYTVGVDESNTSLSCAGSTTTITVDVIAEPTMAFTAADGGGVFGSAAAPFAFCEGDARLGTDVVQAALTHGMNGSPSFQVQYELTVDTSADGGTTWTNIAGLTQTYSGAAGTQQASTTTTHNLTLPAGGFVAIANGGGLQRPTRYTYNLDGINDRITRKCDYITNSAAAATAWSWFDTTDQETLVIVVNPTPVTGPIYHISNMWAN